MNTRFNLFAYGASLHRGSADYRGSAEYRGPVEYRDTDPIDIRFSSRDSRNVRATRDTSGTRDTRDTNPRIPRDIFSSLQEPFGDEINFLTNLLGINTIGRTITRQRVPPDVWGAFSAPVIVAPSAEILAANTEIVTASTLHVTQDRCSICQDSMQTAEICRRLTPCQHVFHKLCIDQWFLRSVHCPTCRHDIRNSTPPSPRLMTAPTPHEEVSGLTLGLDISGNIRH